MNIPGFVDTHIHGAYGVDVSDGNADDIRTLAIRLRQDDVLAFCPTTMTLPEDRIFRCFEAVMKAKEELESEGISHSRILGVHLEGPFFNKETAGVQDASSLKDPGDGFDLIEKLEKDFPDLLKIIDIAPELPGAFEFIDEFKDRYVISLAHTKADYDIACRAFEAGASSVTHLMNAMDPSLKRSPGILGALSDYPDVFAEIICDGIHIAPSYLRMLFKILREDRIIVVSDSMRGARMPDGIYKLAAADVEVRDGRTYFGEEGGLAGSVTYMKQEAERLCSFGIPEDKVARACWSNPLSRLGISSI
ncbi:MAG: amidohydrolase family protein [Clostridiales bacterium]|nr:amidohydrolase family protein [Clostridiales bacterium]